MHDPRDVLGSRSIARRRALLAMGGAGLGALALASPLARRLARDATLPADAFAQACTLSPEQTEGPYHVENPLLRRNVTERRPGVPLFVSLRVASAATCEPITGAVVEIWHADASGAYSGFDGAENDTFMRGRQVTGASGVATFRTVYPGWYTGRTPHIHVKAHVGGSEVHTGQVYFDEAVSAAVYARAPYSARGAQDTTNAEDFIFARGGAQSMLALAPRGDAYWGAITLVVATS
jgi:protocatechuate 3,4-dioxygenase beta subunit